MHTVPAKLFYSYSHADEDLRVQLEKHLAMLQRSGWIVGWSDRRIDAGVEWKDAIDERLREADVILLLISADFLASDYCYDVELKIAMERHRSGEAVVIPVILRPVDWASAPFGRLQALPRDGRAITTWDNRDEAFAQVAAGIREAIRVRPDVSQTDGDSASTPPVRDERVLDAALPTRVTVGHTAELLVMIRRSESDGLRGFVVVEEDCGIDPEDVRSRSFALEFPLDAAGRPITATVTLRVDAPSFEPPRQDKQISVPVEGDSQPCSFLLTPKQSGELIVMLEVLCSDVQQACRRLKTTSHAVAVGQQVGFSLVSMPLLTLAGGGTLSYALLPRPSAKATPVAAKPKSRFPLIVAGAAIGVLTIASMQTLNRTREGGPMTRPAEQPAPTETTDTPQRRQSQARAEGTVIWSGELPPNGRIVITRQGRLQGPGALAGSEVLPDLTRASVTAVASSGSVRIAAMNASGLTIVNTGSVSVSKIEVRWRVRQ